MGALVKLVAILAVPLSLLNMLGGIISGIWLAILGKWGVIGYGILSMFVSAFALGFALLPGTLLAAPAVLMYEKGIKIGLYFFSLLGSLYTAAIITIWCIAILYFFAHESDSNSFIPTLIWSYGVAIAPLTYMTQKESQGGGGEASIMMTFHAQLGLAIVIIAIPLLRISLLSAIYVFAIIMLFSVFLQMIALSQSTRTINE